MRHLIIIEANVADLSWIPDYMQEVSELVKQHGGHYLTRSSHVELLEGEEVPPQFSLVAEFPSREAALAFYESEAYAPYKMRRRSASESKILMVAVENATKDDN